jgi:hypothetical protein
MKMLVQGNVDVLRVEEVGAAYDIAWAYRVGTGAITTPALAHDFLLSNILAGFYKGDRNKIRLANRAIAAYQRGG